MKLLQSHPGEDEDEDEGGDTDDTSFQFDLSADGGYFQSQDLPSPSFYTQEIYQQPPQEINQQPPGEEFYTQESFIFGPGAVSGPSEPQERLFGEIPDPPQPEPILPPERPRRERRARVRYTPSSR